VTLTFDQQVIAGCTGTISLFDATGATPLAQVSAGDTTLAAISTTTYNGLTTSIVTVSFANAASLFTNGRSFYIQISAGAYVSVRNGLAFAGVTGRSWNFDVDCVNLAGAAVTLSSSRRSASGVTLRASANTAAATVQIPSDGSISIPANTVASSQPSIAMLKRNRMGGKTSGSSTVQSITPVGFDYLLTPEGASFFGTVKVCAKFNTNFANAATLTGTQRTGSIQMFKRTRNSANQPVYTVIPQVPEIHTDTGLVCVQLQGFSEVTPGLAIPAPAVAATPAPGSTVAPSPGSPSTPGTILFASASSLVAPAVAMLLALAALLAAALL